MHSKAITTPSTPMQRLHTQPQLLTPANIAKNPSAETPKTRDNKKTKRTPRRAQHSASIPVGNHHYHGGRKTHSVSPPMVGCYASSKWSDSPSARSIPPPPDAWIEECSSSSSSNTSAATSDSENCIEVARLEEKKAQLLTPKSCRQSARIDETSAVSPIPTGRRMCPLQLISEVMALSIGN